MNFWYGVGAGILCAVLLPGLFKIGQIIWHLKLGAHDCVGFPSSYRIGCPHCKQRGFWKRKIR